MIIVILQRRAPRIIAKEIMILHNNKGQTYTFSDLKDALVREGVVKRDYDQGIIRSHVGQIQRILDKFFTGVEGQSFQFRLELKRSSFGIYLEWSKNSEFRVPDPANILIFLCHSSKDKFAVRELYDRLSHSGLKVWLDDTDLIPGQDWDAEIKKAVSTCDVVLVCLSKSSITKAGYVHKEIKFALDVADEKPEGTIFIIPARLEECLLPDRLSRLHCVDIFKTDGFDSLLRAIRHATQNKMDS